MGGIYNILHIDRSDPDQAGKSNELVCQTSVAVFSICLSDYLRVDDCVFANGIEAEKSKWSLMTRLVNISFMT